MSQTSDLSGLSTEERNPRSTAIDRVSTGELLALLDEDDYAVPRALTAALPAMTKLLDAVVGALEAGGRLFYLGAGTSGRLGVLDAAECPPTYGTPAEMVQGVIAGGERAMTEAVEGSEDDAAAGAIDLAGRGFGSADFLIGIAASGRTPYVLGAVEWARRQGGRTGGISCVRGSRLSAAVEFPVEVVCGPEMVTGSTRMKAGTATKIALNRISTGAMIRLGYTFGNLMVNVQPTNEKLRNRAERIVAEATGRTPSETRELLAAGGTVKTAIVMGRLQVDADEAARRLAAAGGRVAEAVLRPAN